MLDDSAASSGRVGSLRGKLNVARLCVHRWAEASSPTRRRRSGRQRTASGALTWRELSSEVAPVRRRVGVARHRRGRHRGGAAADGAGGGDRLARLAHLGAVQVPIFSGFAASAVAARLADAGAKALITADGTLRRGREVALKEVADEALRARRPWPAPSSGGGSAARTRRWWSAATCSGTARGRQGRRRVARRGRFRGAVPAGLHLGHDRTAEGRCTCRAASRSRSCARPPTRPTSRPATACSSRRTWGGSWGRGRWSAAARSRATIVYTEGAPDWPADRLWRLVESERVTMLGVSPTLVQALIPKASRPPICRLFVP